MEEYDWLIWEKRYGRTLNEIERLEIKNNLLAFLSLVEEIYNSKPDYFDGLLAGAKSERSRIDKEAARKNQSNFL